MGTSQYIINYFTLKLGINSRQSECLAGIFLRKSVCDV